MKLPNYLTLSRVAAVFVIVALMMAPMQWAASAAFVLFILAALTDWLDGYVARRFNMISDFGKLMDALADKILMVGMMIALVALDVIPQWGVFLVIVIVGREFLVTGLRLIAASKGQVLAAEKSGKLKTVVQIVAVAILMLSYAAIQDGYAFENKVDQLLTLGELKGFWYGVYSAGIGTFILSAWLTLTSGYGYLKRYGHLLKE